MSRFATIRALAKEGILPEHRLRCLLREGKLPGFYSGTRYLSNVDLLEEQLERWSRLNCEKVDKFRGW